MIWFNIPLHNLDKFTNNEHKKVLKQYSPLHCLYQKPFDLWLITTILEKYYKSAFKCNLVQIQIWKSTLLYFESVKDKYMDTLEKEIHHIQCFPPHQQTLSLSHTHIETQNVKYSWGFLGRRQSVCSEKSP